MIPIASMLIAADRTLRELTDDYESRPIGSGHPQGFALDGVARPLEGAASWAGGPARAPAGSGG